VLGCTLNPTCLRGHHPSRLAHESPYGSQPCCEAATGAAWPAAANAGRGFSDRRASFGVVCCTALVIMLAGIDGNMLPLTEVDTETSSGATLLLPRGPLLRPSCCGPGPAAIITSAEPQAPGALPPAQADVSTRLSLLLLLLLLPLLLWVPAAHELAPGSVAV